MLLCFRMVNVLLPAYSRHYCTLVGAGLLTPADEMESHELEHLVLRERGVVWADQEMVGTGEESHQMDEERTSGLSQELAPILSFSRLLYHQSSPCSKSSWPVHLTDSEVYKLDIHLIFILTFCLKPSS